MDLRLAIPAAASWITAIVVIAFPKVLVTVVTAGWVTVLALLLLAGALRWSRKPHFAGLASPIGVAAVVIAAVSLVASSAAVSAPSRRMEVLGSAGDSGTLVTVTLVTTEAIGDGPFRGTVVSVASPSRLGSAESGTHLPATPSSVPVLVFDAVDAKSATTTGIGTTLRLRGTVTETPPEDDVSYLLFAVGEADVVAGPPGYLEWSNALRAGFSTHALTLPGDGGRLLPGLAIGDTGAVDDRLDAAMKTSSLSHLTAVSGANCAIIIGLIMLAGGAVGLRRGWRIAASIIVLGGFVVLVTPEPSVLRAAVMATLALLAMASGRPVQGLPVLSGAVLLLLTLDPWLARSYGFALSVLATGGLLLIAGPLSRLLARWLPLWLAVVVAVPVAAQLACQPVLVLLDPSLPVFGVLANVLAAPAAPVATVVGLAACIALAVLPPAGAALAAIAWLPAAWIGAVARFFAAAPGARIPWPGGAIGGLTLAVLTVLVLVLIFGRRSGRGRRWAAAGTVVIVVIMLAVAGGARIAERLGRPHDWQVAACDIGQGDATVVRSAGQVAVIDTGPEPERLTACLDTLGISRINLLILSHFDLDHIGGTEAVIGIVDRALVGPSAEPADDALVARLRAGGADVEQVSRGPTGIFGELRWSILWPPARLGDIEPGNPASVIVRFDPVGRCEAGCFSSIFLGDLGEEAQDRMLAANRSLAPVDVVKVSHHGSADQSARLYRTVAARVGLIGVGADNGYGHPTKTLLDILGQTATAVGRTDRDGLVLVAPGASSGSLTLWRERASVDPRVGGGD